MEIPVESVATQIFGIRETEPPLISALFSISAKTLYLATRNSHRRQSRRLRAPACLPPPFPLALSSRSCLARSLQVRKHLGEGWKKTSRRKFRRSFSTVGGGSRRGLALDAVAICIPQRRMSESERAAFSSADSLSRDSDLFPGTSGHTGGLEVAGVGAELWWMTGPQKWLM